MQHPEKRTKQQQNFIMYIWIPFICMLALPWVKPSTTQGTAQRMSSITLDNCRSGIDVYLPEDSVSNIPTYRDDPISVQPKNRTSLQYALNTAVSRAIFLSFIYNWTGWIYAPATGFDLTEAIANAIQPGLNYFYMSNAANVLAGPPGVAASAIFFDANSSYPEWLVESGYFNMTFNLFGARALKAEQANAVDIKDLGSTPDTNYTDSSVYPQNAFYRELVQSNSRLDRIILKAKIRGEDHEFSMMPNDEGELGSISRPYYDCGQSNEWMVSAMSMAVDLLPRWSMWNHLRHLRAVASNTVDVLYESLDNPCTTTGCSTDSTWTTETARLGEIELSKADPNSCSQNSASTPILFGEDFWNTNHLMAVFEVQGRSALRLSHFLSNFLQNNNPANDFKNAEYIQQYYEKYSYELYLHYLGAGPAPPDIDTPMRFIKADHPLTWTWIAAEAFSALVSDGNLMSVGIYFDSGAFQNSQDPVSAFAWKDVNTYSRYNAYVVDLFEIQEHFTTQNWFIEAKNKFNKPKASNGLLHEFSSTQEVRLKMTGDVKPHPNPVTYFAVNYEDGTWLNPYFRCDVRQAGWAASYVAPIYAKTDNGDVEFAGVVKTDAIFTKYHVSM